MSQRLILPNMSDFGLHICSLVSYTFCFRSCSSLLIPSWSSTHPEALLSATLFLSTCCASERQDSRDLGAKAIGNMQSHPYSLPLVTLGMSTGTTISSKIPAEQWLLARSSSSSPFSKSMTVVSEPLPTLNLPLLHPTEFRTTYSIISTLSASSF